MERTLNRCRKASRKELEAVFERRLALVDESVGLYHDYLQDYLYRLTSQWQDAENLLQDLWQHVLHRFPEDKIASLPILRRKAWQIFVDFYRVKKRRGEWLTDEVPEPLVGTFSPEPHSEAEEASLKERFWSDFPGIELTENQKEAIWLHARLGLTYKEIESELGVPSSTVCDWIALARREIAAFLNNQR